MIDLLDSLRQTIYTRWLDTIVPIHHIAIPMMISGISRVRVTSDHTIIVVSDMRVLMRSQVQEI